MTTRSFAWLLGGSLALALSSLAGCSTDVSDPSGNHGDDINDSSTDPSSSSDDSCGSPDDPTNAIAISQGALEAFENSQGAGGGSSSSGGSGGGVDFNSSTIVIQATNHPIFTCDDPLVPTDCSGGKVWQVSVELAPSKIAPGTFDLSDPSLNAFYSVTEGGSSDGTCSGGGGSFIQGQLVIDTVDSTAIHFHLTGTNGNDTVEGVEADGKYMATRCD